MPITPKRSYELSRLVDRGYQAAGMTSRTAAVKNQVCAVCKKHITDTSGWTEAGRREFQISGICEPCFDRICAEAEDAYPDGPGEEGPDELDEAELADTRAHQALRSLGAPEEQEESPDVEAHRALRPFGAPEPVPQEPEDEEDPDGDSPHPFGEAEEEVDWDDPELDWDDDDEVEDRLSPDLAPDRDCWTPSYD